jgi:hypothetical protein
MIGYLACSMLYPFKGIPYEEKNVLYQQHVDLQAEQKQTHIWPMEEKILFSWSVANFQGGIYISTSLWRCKAVWEGGDTCGVRGLQGPMPILKFYE